MAFGCTRLNVTEDCFIPTNYEKIVNRISAIPLEQAHIQFNTVMTSVASREDREDGLRRVCVTTSDDKKEFFDEVVITTPLGWLKQHLDSIPQLPPRISSAIRSISFGRLEKVNHRFVL